MQTDVAGAANDDCDGLVERAEAAADRGDAAWSMLPPRSQRQRQDTWWDDAYDDALGVVASATDELAFLVLEAPDCFSPEQRAGARQLQSEVGRLVDRR